MLDHSAHAAVLAQQCLRAAIRFRGISESSSAEKSGWALSIFRVRRAGLGLNHDGVLDELVVSPYSTFLALEWILAAR